MKKAGDPAVPSHPQVVYFPEASLVSLFDLYRNNFEILNMVSRIFMPSKSVLLLFQKKEFSLLKMSQITARSPLDSNSFEFLND